MEKLEHVGGLCDLRRVCMCTCVWVKLAHARGRAIVHACPFVCVHVCASLVTPCVYGLHAQRHGLAACCFPLCSKPASLQAQPQPPSPITIVCTGLNSLCQLANCIRQPASSLASYIAACRPALHLSAYKVSAFRILCAHVPPLQPHCADARARTHTHRTHAHMRVRTCVHTHVRTRCLCAHHVGSVGATSFLEAADRRPPDLQGPAC